VAIAIKMDSKGPVFFRQTRHGFNGRPFVIYKFRSMTVMENGDVVRQAQKHDARVTRVGHWIRRLSVDELPQLINVVYGDMSIVGPRPHASAHDRYFTSAIEKYAFRHHVKSGITGWAQVCGARGETDTLDKMQRRVELDRRQPLRSGPQQIRGQSPSRPHFQHVIPQPDVAQHPGDNLLLQRFLPACRAAQPPMNPVHPAPFTLATCHSIAGLLLDSSDGPARPPSAESLFLPDPALGTPSGKPA
jgi:hypothetical protein